MRKARVFISCGQRTEREKRIGSAVEQHFRGRGFDAYFAEKVHSPKALTDHIFRSLEASEYFVFVDFKRDRLPDDDFRGSLFVNQEFAIATFLEVPGLGFQEIGVRREGIADYQIWNPLPFEGESDILKQLPDQTKDWDPDSVNELFIEYDTTDVNEVLIANQPGTPKIKSHHLRVANRNRRKHAFSCTGYVTKIVDLENAVDLDIPTNELIWSGVGGGIRSISLPVLFVSLMRFTCKRATAGSIFTRDLQRAQRRDTKCRRSASGNTILSSR